MLVCMEKPAAPKPPEAEGCSAGRRAEATQWAPWSAVIAALLTVAVNLYLNHVERQETRRARLLEDRREALFEALTVIDHVYCNEPIGRGGQKPCPHEWDAQLARDAMNRMVVFCKDARTVELFTQAIGLYNPEIEKPRGIDLKALVEFRRQVARELELADPGPGDPERVWIRDLAGAK